MTTTHTQGRLQVPAPYDDQFAVIVEKDGRPYAVALSIRNPADARRLAATWNACDGMSTELLENILMLGDTMLTRFQARDRVEQTIIADRLRFMQERDALLKALTAIAQSAPNSTVLGLQQTAASAITEPAQPSAPRITTNSASGNPDHTCTWVDTHPSGSKCTTCGDTIPF